MSEEFPTVLEVASPELAEIEDKSGPRQNEHGEPIPPGALLTDRLQAALANTGWNVDYRWTTYDGHAFDARRGDNRYDVEVTLLDRETARYRVIAKPRVGLLRRVFKGRLDPAEHKLLRVEIDRALLADGRIQVVTTWAVADD